MCITCETNLNAAALDAFGERFLNLLNDGALIMMMSVGYRTGLFEAMAGREAMTSEAIAEHAGLNERYVREWLGAMATGGIVTCDQSGKWFRLPAEHAALLTDHGESENLGHLTQFVSMIGFIEDKLIHCFHNGGGIPYTEFPRFHEIMAIDSKQSIVDPLFEHILPLVPGLSLQLHNGISVLDVGCGRGKAMLKLAERFPKSRFTGYELSAEAVDYANTEVVDRGLRNLEFVQRDLTNFDTTAPEATFNLITAFDAIHDQGRPDHVLKGIHRALKPDGTFFMQDIGASSNIAENVDHPIGSLLYGISCSHCMTVSLAQGGLGVGAMWGEEMTRQFLTDAGFTSIERHTLEHDLQNFYYVVRK